MVNSVLNNGNIYVGFFAGLRNAVTFLMGLVGPIFESLFLSRGRGFFIKVNQKLYLRVNGETESASAQCPQQ